jgi:hypothetical protein
VWDYIDIYPTQFQSQEAEMNKNSVFVHTEDVYEEKVVRCLKVKGQEYEVYLTTDPIHDTVSVNIGQMVVINIDFKSGRIRSVGCIDSELRKLFTDFDEDTHAINVNLSSWANPPAAGSEVRNT